MGSNEDDDGCVDLEAELAAFNDELNGKHLPKNLISKDVLRMEEVKRMARVSLNAGPGRNGRAKLEQLKMLEELHLQYMPIAGPTCRPISGSH